MSRIETLTPEQETLIPVYRDKWKQIALSTERIDRQKATEAVKAAYAALGKKKPEIIICESPYTGMWKCLHLREQPYLGRQMWGKLWMQLLKQLEVPLIRQLEAQLAQQLFRRFEEQLLRHVQMCEVEEPLRLRLSQVLLNVQHDCINPDVWANSGSMFEVCISVLNCDRDQNAWEAFQLLGESSSWIYPFEKTCIVCDRPKKLSFDSENRLHAQGEPAIEFADEYRLYCYHGETLPEKYGALHPHEWRSQFLLEELNAQVRRVLIQAISYKRICQELEAVELDSWQEYSLIRIDQKIDVEPISLLKMTCPSTGEIHILRVPPKLKSAREAIHWVNWGIYPEEFIIQT